MEVILSGIAKHFGREAVFGGVDLELASGSRTAVLGPNGSGKSTLLQVIAGALVPTAGRIEHRLQGRTVDPEQVYRHISIAAPYLHLYEELSLAEAVDNHRRFKPLLPEFDTEALARTAYLEKHLAKPVRHLSSGMRQRLKLALAILSDTSLLLLDEPASNLDTTGIDWYNELLRSHLADRTLVVASNHEAVETALCRSSVAVDTWKGGLR